MWATSIHGVSFWTRYAEEWYQMRLRAIRSNEADCRSHQDWRKTLPNGGKPVKLTTKVRDAAAMFIDGTGRWE